MSAAVDNTITAVAADQQTKSASQHFYNDITGQRYSSAFNFSMSKNAIF